MTAATAVEAANSLTNTGLITMTMPAPVPPSFMGGVGGMIDASSRVFVSTPTTYLPLVSASVLPMATSAIGAPTTIAAIQERQFLASMLPGHSQQRMLRERQMLMLQMRQRHQRQAQLQLLEEMSAYDGDNFLSSYDSYKQPQVYTWSSHTPAHQTDLSLSRSITRPSAGNAGCRYYHSVVLIILRAQSPMLMQERGLMKQDPKGV
eukprot:scaffold192_cov160-Skeletonema_marinoi.AAC.1